MKLAPECLLSHLLTPILPGVDHQGEAFGPPLLDGRLHLLGAYRGHDQRHSWPVSTWGAEPPQGLQKTDPRHVGVLQPG